MVDDGVIGTIETCRQHFFRQSHADRVRETLAERTGRGFDCRKFAVLRMTGGLRVQLAEALDFLDREIVAGQMQQRIQQHRTVAVAEHETIAIEPFRIRRVMAEEIIPQHFGDVGHAHRHARMAGFRGFDRIHGQRSNGVREFSTARHDDSL